MCLRDRDELVRWVNRKCVAIEHGTYEPVFYLWLGHEILIIQCKAVFPKVSSMEEPLKQCLFTSNICLWKRLQAKKKEAQRLVKCCKMSDKNSSLYFEGYLEFLTVLKIYICLFHGFLWNSKDVKHWFKGIQIPVRWIPCCLVRVNAVTWTACIP